MEGWRGGRTKLRREDCCEQTPACSFEKKPPRYRFVRRRLVEESVVRLRLQLNSNRPHQCMESERLRRTERPYLSPSAGLNDTPLANTGQNGAWWRLQHIRSGSYGMMRGSDVWCARLGDVFLD